MSVHKLPGDKYYVMFRDETGRQHKKMFGRGPLAKKEAEAYDLHLKADRKVGIKPEAPRTGIYLDYLAQKYLDERRTIGKVSQHYIYSLTLLMNNCVLPILNQKPVDELTYTDDMLRVADLYKDRKPATLNRYFGYLLAIFRFGIRHGIAKNNPLAQWKKAKEEPRPSLITVEDVKKIIACAPDHLKWGMQVEWNLVQRG